MIAMHRHAATTAACRWWGVAGCCRVLGHWLRQGFGGFDLDVDQEVAEVPEAGICISKICLDAFAGLKRKVRGRSAMQTTE